MRARVPLVLAAACLAAGPAIATGSTTIRFVSVQVAQTQTRSGFTIANDDFQGTTKIGHDRLVCTYGADNKATCIIRVSLAKGTIRGRITVSQSTTAGPIAITGGTRAYKGATGGGAFKNLNKAATRTAVALHLK